MISTEIVGLLRDHYGHGPRKAKTYVMDDLVICVLRDGRTPVEQTMIDGGNREGVLSMRRDFQDVMGERYSQAIERLTGRKVVAFLSQTHVNPDIAVEIFVMDQPLVGFSAADLDAGAT